MEEISIKAEEIFNAGNFIVTNSLLLSFLASFLLIAFVLVMYGRIKLIPGKTQGFLEISAEWFLDLMRSTLGPGATVEKYFPFVATVFIFILTSNLLGILPGVGSVVLHEGSKEVPLFRSPAADLNFTLAFAVLSVIVTNVLGAMAVGVFPHISKFLNFKNPIAFFIGILEFVSEIAKIISLSFRLFGNVFAGEVLLTIMFFLAPYLVPLPFLMLELFVGLIQAFLFAMLTLVSISLHTAIEEH